MLHLVPVDQKAQTLLDHQVLVPLKYQVYQEDQEDLGGLVDHVDPSQKNPQILTWTTLKALFMVNNIPGFFPDLGILNPPCQQMSGKAERILTFKNVVIKKFAFMCLLTERSPVPVPGGPGGPGGPLGPGWPSPASPWNNSETPNYSNKSRLVYVSNKVLKFCTFWPLEPGVPGLPGAPRGPAGPWNPEQIKSMYPVKTVMFKN